MLYPLENAVDRELNYTCRHCEHLEKAEASEQCIWRNKFKHTAAELTLVVDDVVSDPTLGHITAKCERCNGTEAVFFQSQSADETEGMRLTYICVTCRYRWKSS